MGGTRRARVEVGHTGRRHRNDPQIAHALSNLAGAYQQKSDYAQAESLYRRALAMREKNFGAEHYEIAVNLNNLAALCHATRRTKEAKRLYTRALTIKEKLDARIDDVYHETFDD